MRFFPPSCEPDVQPNVRSRTLPRRSSEGFVYGFFRVSAGEDEGKGEPGWLIMEAA